MSETNTIKPSCINRGDTIGIVAPASSFDPDNFKKGIKKLRKSGYKVKYERSIFSKYWSRPGHDKKRAEQINRMFADTQVKALFCAKGGWGSLDIIPYLDKGIIKDNPKIFVGYSDITFLLLYLQSITNMVVFHGPVVSGEIYEGMSELTLDCLFRLIAKPEALGTVTTPHLHPLKPGQATGILVGGNMSSIVESIGTEYDVDTNGRILFLEEVGEDMATIEEYLNRLKQAGKFMNIKGIVFGKMVNCFDETDTQKSRSSIINEIVADVKVPILFGFPSGHIKQSTDIHFTLPLGAEVTLDADRPALVINEAAVQ